MHSSSSLVLNGEATDLDLDTVISSYYRVLSKKKKLSIITKISRIIFSFHAVFTKA